ncbi:hypothetical protein BDQ17DRAFT_1187410, partial [Cyathus striatus]
ELLRIDNEKEAHWIAQRAPHHSDLVTWLGHLLSWKGIEELLEALICDVSEDLDSDISDIWQSSIFTQLKDDLGGSFFPEPGDEGRLIFSISVDSFDPFGMKTAKQSALSTGIWLALLNLPPHLRYLQENVYLVGVIP